MKTGWILIESYCSYHQIDPEFVSVLANEGLIVIEQIEKEQYISENQLADLEKFVRWHQELEVNVAGIDIIHQLLSKMDRMRGEINILRRKLSQFNDNDPEW